MARNYVQDILGSLGQAEGSARRFTGTLNTGLGQAKAGMDGLQSSAEGLADQMDQVGGQLGGFGGIISGIGASFLRFMFNPITMIVGLLATAVSRLNEMEKNAMNVARTLGHGQQNVSHFAAETQTLVDRFRHLGVSGENITSLTNQMGTSMSNMNMVSMRVVGEITKLGIAGGDSASNFASAYTNILQMSQGMARTKQEAIRTAESTLNYARNLAAANAVPITSMMSQLANISDAVATTMGSNPKALSQAIVQASQLGTTLEQVAGIMNNMLNFEQSIQNEMEASVVLGKNLNMEKLRAASFAGDEVAVMRELKSLVGTQAEFEKMLPIQRQMYAQALGMSVTELQKMAGFETQADIQARKRQEATDQSVRLTTTFMEEMHHVITQIKIAFSSVMAGPVESFRNWMRTEGAGGKTGLDRIREAAQGLAGYLQQAVQWIADFVSGGQRTQQIRDVLSGIRDVLANVISWLGQGEGKWKNWQKVMIAIAAVKLSPIITSLTGISSSLAGVTQGFMGARGSAMQLVGTLGSLYTAYQGLQQFQQGNSGKGLAMMGGMALGGLVGGPMGAALGGQAAGYFVNDAIIRPGAPPINIHPSDTLIAVKEAGGGASYISHKGMGTETPPPQPINYNFDLGPVVAKLDSLTSAILQGGKVYLDGRAVGRADNLAATGAA